MNRLSLPWPLPAPAGGGLVSLVLLLGALSAGTALAQTPSPDAPPAPTQNAAPTVSGGRITRPTLRPGSQGESVKELQSVLMLLGYYPGPVSGVYQDETQTAVQQFQAAAGIIADGVVGPATWSSLFPAPVAEATPPAAEATPPTAEATPVAATPDPTPSPTPATPSPEPVASPSQPATSATPTLRPGMEGEAVKQLQQRLKTKGFYNGPIDGVFGSQTEAAVRAAQSANNLTVDGIVGPATWGILN
ncbi:MAG: peptidoglycan-binding protein [Nodosilinea sp.]